jgi:2-iminobutanoate/2-iminopropanoate deaminase
VSVQSVSTNHAPAAIGPYSQGIVSGGLLFTAGQIALDPTTGTIVEGGIAAQTARVLENLSAILAAAGAGWPDVVKTTIYLTDLSHFGTVNDLYASALGTARPARSTVQVSALPRGAVVEIDAVAQIAR